MSQKEYGQIRARKSSQETLKRLSELTGYDVIDILEQWTTEIEKVLNDFENPTRISYMSARNLGKDRNLVITYLSKMVTTSFSVGNDVSDSEAEKKAREKVKPK